MNRTLHQLLCVGFIFIFSVAVPHALRGTNDDTGDADEKEPVTPSTTEVKSDAVERSVVKVFSTIRAPEFAKPWAKQSPREISGSGVVIEGHRILTCAHVVLYSSQIQVQADQSGDKLSATVEAVAPGIDLAVLKLDDDSFFTSHPPLLSADRLPQSKDAVLVYGFPTGGNNLSTTKGIVSRVEFTSYSQSVAGLRVQIDAAVNPGNSGGPAVVDGKMIGLAFRRLNNAENIGYIIPSEEIDLFLKDIADGRYDGKPALFDEYQTLENPSLRSFLKLDKSTTGVVVSEPFDNSPSYPLKQWDVITKIGDAQIDDEGMIAVNENLRVRFHYLVQKIAKDGKIPLTIIRAGKEISVQVPTLNSRPLLIPDLEGDYPSYFICGPLVFSTPTSQFLSVLDVANTALRRQRNPINIIDLMSIAGNPLITRRADKPAFPGESLVIVPAPMFPHRLSKGYSSPAFKVVKAINGIPVKNLNHLVEIFRDSKDEFITIEFFGHNGEVLVFPRAELLSATDEILADNGVRSQGSPDTLAIWNKKS